LLKAAGKGDLKEVERLTKEGANLDAISQEGHSALTNAIRTKQNKVAKFLLENGATTERSGFLVYKPLHVAVSSGNLEMIVPLLDHGADIDETTAHGTVLTQSIKAGRREITSLLLARNADLNLANHAIFSPLGAAVVRRDERVIRDLLKHGADLPLVGEKVVETNLRLCSETCRTLVRDWRAGKYEEQVKIVRSPYEEFEEKKEALALAARKAAGQGQKEVTEVLMELRKEILGDQFNT
jgi:ankyrin repeat protein